ncbi:hypothetical protein [Ottowia thiooxydans]|uniref:hypothetical protein n=1 Tax=Ottowia thiooxydans TaxID=219182 RepID=UPI0012EB5528|nr:hypothetical protein [Ottowia thiooxydans]
MYRLFIVLFLLLTSSQLAVAGLPSAGVHTMNMTQDARIGHSASEVCTGAESAQSLSSSHSLDCHSSSSCGVCGNCHACQQAAIPDGQWLQKVAGPVRGEFSWLTTRVASVEQGPILKPPIR